MIDTTLAQGVYPLFLVEEEYRLALLEIESGFAERFIEQIADPVTGWGRAWAEFRRDTARPDFRR